MEAIKDTVDSKFTKKGREGKEINALKKYGRAEKNLLEALIKHLFNKSIANLSLKLSLFF